MTPAEQAAYNRGRDDTLALAVMIHQAIQAAAAWADGAIQANHGQDDAAEVAKAYHAAMMWDGHLLATYLELPAQPRVHFVSCRSEVFTARLRSGRAHHSTEGGRA